MSKPLWQRLNQFSHDFIYDSVNARLLSDASQHIQKLEQALVQIRDLAHPRTARSDHTVRQEALQAALAALPGSPDFELKSYGSICILTPQSEAARRWLEDNVINNETQRWGAAGVVVEPRYVSGLMDAIAEAGLGVA